MRVFSFNRYPAKPLFTGKPARLILDNKDAQDYVTELQSVAKKGTNFAGHYAIANHLNRAMGGKDTAAIVDLETGKVYLPQPLRGYHDQRGAGYNPPRPDGGLHYHNNSNLLIIVGLPGNSAGAKVAGRYYYKWDKNQLKLLRFVSSPYSSTSSQ